ncbi:hypothetical protein [Helicobacter pylori]|uniref:hypothetical protein n=1 Tax=Helicobacter pylori TaxID=210 RepID=UPI001FBB3741|nr:hypothetical protein [Helicobacter pylori]
MKIKAVMLGLVVSGALLFASDYEDNVFGYTTGGEPIYKKKQLLGPLSIQIKE